MRNFYLLVLSCIFLLSVNMFLYGQQVTKQEAQNAAQHFFEQAKENSSPELIFSEVSDTNDTLWYVFSGQNNFLILSGNYKASPIIGYSFNSSFPLTQNFPASFRQWMDKRTEELNWLFQNNTEKNQHIHQQWSSLCGDNTFTQVKEQSIAPLLVSQWDQTCFYNELCPADNAGPCGHAYVGCVATAMGQIMYYYRYPKNGNGTNSYTHPEYGNLSVNFGSTEYKWNEMRSKLNLSSASLAQLLYHAGVAVEMDYSAEGSGSSPESAAQAFVQRFKYSTGIELKYSYYFSTDEWKQKLIDNLSSGYPILYAGRKDLYEAGHAFVLDGYDGNGMFHFDWGWSGYYNGYFSIENLNPAGYDFNWGQAAIFNIAPPVSATTYFCTGLTTLTSPVGSLTDGSGPLKNYSPSANCSWLIQPEIPVDNIILKFVNFDTEPNSDIVTVYNGNSVQAPLIGQYSGNSLPSQIQSSGQALFITFTTNSSVEKTGWLAEYTTNPTKLCALNNLITDMEGTISDGSGQYQYSNNTICRWNIIPPDASKIMLDFTEFRTEPTNDVLKIIDLNTNAILSEFSGAQLPTSQVYNTSKIRLQFVSNESITDSGWTINYSVLTSTAELPGNSEISVFPNPSDAEIVINGYTFSRNKIFVDIYDLTGRTCYSTEITGFSSSIQINISNLTQGPYFMKISDGSKFYVCRIFKTT